MSETTDQIEDKLRTAKEGKYPTGWAEVIALLQKIEENTRKV